MKTKSIVEDVLLPRRPPSLARRRWEAGLMLKLTVEHSIVRKGYLTGLKLALTRGSTFSS
jgi:hypothetical protein